MRASRTSGTIRPEHIERETAVSSITNAIGKEKEINDLDDKEMDEDTEN